MSGVVLKVVRPNFCCPALPSESPSLAPPSVCVSASNNGLNKISTPHTHIPPITSNVGALFLPPFLPDMIPEVLPPPPLLQKTLSHSHFMPPLIPELEPCLPSSVLVIVDKYCTTGQRRRTQ